MEDMNLSYIIGETAYLHEGDYDYLLRMIDEIADIGLNAVKFHLLLNPESYMQKNHPLLETIKEWLFTEEEWSRLFAHSISKGLDVMALCDDVESIEYIINSGLKVKAIEVHATSLNDHFILEVVSKFKGMIFLGIGGSTLDEIHYAIDMLNNNGADDIVLMYGFQSYPTNYSDINLSKMMRIKNLFNLPMGYADHTAFDDPNNELVSVMGAALGLNILEKHYTLDFGVERIDYHASVGKKQMLKIKEMMEIALAVHGSWDMAMSKPELDYGNVGPMKKAVVARRPIKAGESLTLDNLWFKRTEEESTLKQNQFLQLVGQKARTDIEADEIIDFSKVDYQFKKLDLDEFTHVKKEEKWK